MEVERASKASETYAQEGLSEAKISYVEFSCFCRSKINSMNVIGGNWVDLVILIILAYFASEAWRLGFWIILADFLGFLVSILISLWGYQYASQFLQNNFSLPHSVSNALGFLLVAGFAEGFFGYLFFRLIKTIPYKFWRKPWNNLAAIIPSLGQGIIIISFILMLLVSLPVVPSLKKDITKSRIGGFLVKETSGVEARLNEIFGGLVNDSLTYLTVKPGSTLTIPLNIGEERLTIDEVSENEMVNLVNQERQKRGIGTLSLRKELVPVAETHAIDMWQRHYFGHISPEGYSVKERIEKMNISFNIVGENLALAPTLETAHIGLMNSEGHRANILDPEFKRIGIGVVDNGFYGKMFVQIFTD